MRIPEYQRFDFGNLLSETPKLKFVQAIQILKFVNKDLNSEITNANFEIRFTKYEVKDLNFVKPGS